MVNLVILWYPHTSKQFSQFKNNKKLLVLVNIEANIKAKQKFTSIIIWLKIGTYPIFLSNGKSKF